MQLVVDILWISRPGTRYSGVAKIQPKSRARVSLASLAPGLDTPLLPKATPIPPFFNKHSLYLGEQGLRVTITH